MTYIDGESTKGQDNFKVGGDKDNEDIPKQLKTFQTVENIPKQLATLGYDAGEFTETAQVCRTNMR